MNAIEAKDLTKHYPGFTLDNIRFVLPQGCVLGLVGENGAGKSTLIRLLMGAARPDGGSATVLGEDSRSKNFQKVKEDVGVVLDEACLPGQLTAGQLRRVLRATFRNWDDGLWERLLRELDIPGGKAVSDFSRGMRMKLAIAAALSHRPRLLVLDEPTGGLDPVVRDEILDIFNDFTREEDHSILISSHIVTDLEKLCDYIAFLHKGKLVLFEEKDRLYEQYGLVRTTNEALADLPEEAVLGVRRGPYGAEALVLREQVAEAFAPERAGLEDIIVFMAKGEKL